MKRMKTMDTPFSKRVSLDNLPDSFREAMKDAKP